MALISDIFGNLIACKSKYDSDLYNFFYLKTGDEISWRNRLKPAPFEDYEGYYSWVAENNQYSFARLSDAYFQIYYFILDGKVDRASLAYLPDYNSDPTGASYIRIDCDHSSHRDYVHTAYHAHFGYQGKTRVSVLKFPTPQEFYLFILNSIYKVHKIDTSSAGIQIPDLIALKCNFYNHLKIAP